MSNDVTFELIDGENSTPCVLTPTHGAASGISRAFDGKLMKAIEAVGALDPRAIEVVIAYGMDLTPAGQKKIDLPARIYETGYVKLATPCVEFLTILLNGGKRPDEMEEAKRTEGEA